jgi:hypothetical protein
MKAEFLDKLAAHLTVTGLLRVHAESTEPTARAAVEAFAGLPHFDQLWAGDLHLSLQIIIVVSADRVPGVEFARRARLLRERAASMSGRVKGEVQVLQLALYDRPVPVEERQFVVEKARAARWWPFSHGRVATWVVAFGERALHAGPFRGWPSELGAEQLRALL